jgi:pimeloyl-ACP methyl ester carboxylesterase
MSLTTEGTEVASWGEPDGIAPRGTLIVIPGRGERPELYERFGRRIAADGYRVHVVADPVADAGLTTAQVLDLAAGVRPLVLAGSDTGALFAAGLAASSAVADADALVLAGLPVTGDSTGESTGEPLTGKPLTGEPLTGEPLTGESPAGAFGSSPPPSWDAELDSRTACPTHRGRLAGAGLRRGALYEPVPDGWAALADLERVAVPVLGVHGTDDPISPLDDARARYAAAPRAELVSIVGGRHDALNDVTHRTVAATVVLFLERLRLGADLPAVAVSEKL